MSITSRAGRLNSDPKGVLYVKCNRECNKHEYEHEVGLLAQEFLRNWVFIYMPHKKHIQGGVAHKYPSAHSLWHMTADRGRSRFVFGRF